MEKVRLGRTNLEVARLGWGGIPIQRISEDEAVARRQAIAQVIARSLRQIKED